MPRGLLHLLDDVWGDLGYAFRTLVRTPGFGVAVVSLGLAVGATGAVYGTHGMVRSLQRDDGVR